MPVGAAGSPAPSAAFDTLVEAYLGSVDWEPAVEIEKRAAHLVPALDLARIDGKSPVEYLTEERDKAVGPARSLDRDPSAVGERDPKKGTRSLWMM